MFSKLEFQIFNLLILSSLSGKQLHLPLLHMTQQVSIPVCHEHTLFLVNYLELVFESSLLISVNHISRPSFVVIKVLPNHDCTAKYTRLACSAKAADVGTRDVSWMMQVFLAVT